MKRYNSPISPQLVIPASFAECMTYEKQILWLKKEIDSVSIGVEPEVIAEIQNQLTLLSNEVSNLNDEIDGYNIQAIQESIEQLTLNVENLRNSIETKQDKLTFDTTPTLNSQNPVTSNGIKEAIDNEGMRLEQLVNDKVDETTFNDAVNNITDNYATKSEISDMATKEELSDYVTDAELENTISTLATKTEVANKQDKLTFDDTPTIDSQNPVTSDGIKKAIDAATPSITIDDTVTSTSENPVRSSGIYQYVQEETSDLVNNSELANYATKSEISDMATKTELNNYATKSEISDFVTNETLNSSISTLATKSEISDMATQTDLLSYATKEELTGYVTDTELENTISTLATKTEVANKQDKLTFDDTPTMDSQNPVTSDGIKKAIDVVSTEIPEVDSTVSQSSQNPVSSNGIYNFVVEQLGDLVTNEQLSTKQDKLTFDDTPTTGSVNPVTSGGIKTAIDNSAENAAATYATKTALNTSLSKKQDILTFDISPRPNSRNPVWSEGIYDAIQNAGKGKITNMDTSFVCHYYGSPDIIDGKVYFEQINEPKNSISPWYSSEITGKIQQTTAIIDLPLSTSRTDVDHIIIDFDDYTPYHEFWVNNVQYIITMKNAIAISSGGTVKAHLQYVTNPTKHSNFTKPALESIETSIGPFNRILIYADVIAYKITTT